MSEFKMTYPNGTIEHEVVADCHTLGAYLMRKFGSVFPHQHGVKVEMLDSGEQHVSGQTIETPESVTTGDTGTSDVEAFGDAGETSSVGGEVSGDTVVD